MAEAEGLGGGHPDFWFGHPGTGFMAQRQLGKEGDLARKQGAEVGASLETPSMAFMWEDRAVSWICRAGRAGEAWQQRLGSY